MMYFRTVVLLALLISPLVTAAPKAIRETSDDPAMDLAAAPTTWEAFRLYSDDPENAGLLHVTPPLRICACPRACIVPLGFLPSAEVIGDRCINCAELHGGTCNCECLGCAPEPITGAPQEPSGSGASSSGSGSGAGSGSGSGSRTASARGAGPSLPSIAEEPHDQT